MSARSCITEATLLNMSLLPGSAGIVSGVVRAPTCWGWEGTLNVLKVRADGTHVFSRMARGRMSNTAKGERICALRIAADAEPQSKV